MSQNRNNVDLLQPKVLFVTTVVPIPINAGNKQRTDQSIRALLMTGAEVTILVHTRANKERTIASLKAAYPGSKIVFVGKVVTVSQRLHRRQYFDAVLKIVGDFLEKITLRHWLISNRTECPPHFLREIRRQAKRHNVYFSNYAKATPILNFSFQGTTICDTHDLQSRREAILLRRVEPNWIMRTARIALFQLSEKLALRKFDHVLSISDFELPAMRRLVGHGPVFHYAPATFDIPGNLGDAIKRSYDIGFIGTGSKANVDGLVWFLREVFPDLLRRKPGLTMRIVGRVTLNQSVKDAASPYEIAMTEFLEDVAPAYSSARVWLCPIRFGTGMKIKAVEGLAMAAALVGTSTAFESIAVQDGHDAMIADDAQTFADKIDLLLGDEELASRLRANARTLYERDHSLSAYSSLLGDLMSTRQSAGHG